jgi:hypothetical protein
MILQLRQIFLTEAETFIFFSPKTLSSVPTLIRAEPAPLPLSNQSPRTEQGVSTASNRYLSSWIFNFKKP